MRRLDKLVLGIMGAGLATYFALALSVARDQRAGAREAAHAAQAAWPAAAATQGVEPTGAPAPAPPVVPTDPPLPPTSTPGPTPPPKRLWIATGDGTGAYLRGSPRMDDKTTAYPDGTPLEVRGEAVEGDGQRWAPVRAADGAEGYILLAYTRDTAPPPTPTPAPSPTAIPSVGDIAENGTWRVRLVQSQRVPVIGRKHPQGEFLVLDIAITNLGTKTMALHEWDFTVLRGPTEYSLSDDGSWELLGINTASYEVLVASVQVQPELSKKTRLVFDVPPGAPDLVLKAADLRFAIPTGKRVS